MTQKGKLAVRKEVWQIKSNRLVSNDLMERKEKERWNHDMGRIWFNGEIQRHNEKSTGTIRKREDESNSLIGKSAQVCLCSSSN